MAEYTRFAWPPGNGSRNLERRRNTEIGGSCGNSSLAQWPGQISRALSLRCKDDTGIEPVKKQSKVLQIMEPARDGFASIRGYPDLEHYLGLAREYSTDSDVLQPVCKV